MSGDDVIEQTFEEFLRDETHPEEHGGVVTEDQERRGAELGAWLPACNPCPRMCRFFGVLTTPVGSAVQ